MKKIILILSFAVLMIGCSSAPVAMKTNKKFFTPIKTYAQKPTTTNSKLTSAKTAKELSEKETVIELLKKENQLLRERISKLEKQLAIIQS